MTQWLRDLAALVQDSGSAPSTPMVVHNHLQLQCQNTLFWPLSVPKAHIHSYKEALKKQINEKSPLDMVVHSFNSSTKETVAGGISELEIS